MRKNKKNNQLNINLPRKSLDFLKNGRDPKFLKKDLKESDFEW